MTWWSSYAYALDRTSPVASDLMTYLRPSPRQSQPLVQWPTYVHDLDTSNPCAKTYLHENVLRRHATDLRGEVTMHEALRMQVLETFGDVTGKLDPDWPGQRSWPFCDQLLQTPTIDILKEQKINAIRFKLMFIINSCYSSLKFIHQPLQCFLVF